MRCRRAASFNKQIIYRIHTMELKLDVEKFDELQALFIRGIVETIKVKAVESGLQGDQLERLTGEIAFSIASLIDDTSRIETDGVEVRPYLTFRDSDEELVHCGENSETYEYVMAAIKNIFNY